VAAPMRRQAPITGSRTRCAHSSRHATRRAGSPPAVSRLGGASRTTPSPTAWAARPARATCLRYAAAITGLNRRRAGGSNSRSRASWCGRFPPAAATGSSRLPIRETAPDKDAPEDGGIETAPRDAAGTGMAGAR
jgi:hypothetical protein